MAQTRAKTAIRASASGCGYGDPRERPRELVLEDVRDGLLSPDRAREIYGIG